VKILKYPGMPFYQYPFCFGAIIFQLKEEPAVDKTGKHNIIFDEPLHQGWRMRERQRTAKLADVALKAGVSTALASFVLGGFKGKNMRVNPETASRIQEAARGLSYHPNAAARSLSTRRTGCIGYVMSDEFEAPWRNEYYGKYLCGVESACKELGYGLMIGTCNLRDAEKFAMPPKMAQRCVDGIIIIGGIAPALWEKFKAHNIPAVVLDYTPETKKPPYVCVSSVKRWEPEALKHALSMGHRNIGFCLSGYSECYNFTFRRMKNILKETAAKISKDCNIHIFQSADGGASWEKTMGDYLRSEWDNIPKKLRPTLIMGPLNLSNCVVSGFIGRGVRVPDDLSVIIGHDTPGCIFTAFNVDLEAEGAAAVRMLADHLDHGAPLSPLFMNSADHIKMIERGSVKNLKDKGTAVCASGENSH
jgi:DNA-binding LacI/PurR family transcriptional regulator